MQYLFPVILALCGTLAMTFSLGIFDEPLFNKSRILFDVTELTVGSLSNLSLQDVRVSPYVYYSEIVEGRVIPKGFYMSITDVSYIFASNKYSNHRDFFELRKSTLGNLTAFLRDANEREIEGIVFQVNSAILYTDVEGGNENICVCRAVSEELIENFEATLATQNKYITVIGIEITELLLDCCSTQFSKTQSFLFLEKIDLVVLYIEITPETTMLSSRLFTSKLEKYILKFQQFVRRFNPKCVMVLRIKFNSKHVLQDNIRHIYLSYFKTYLEEWNNSVDEKLKIVLETYPKVVKPTTKNLRNDVVPTVSDNYIRRNQDNLKSVCQFQEIINSISHSFNNVFLDQLDNKVFYGITECHCKKFIMTERPKNLKFYIRLRTEDSETISMLEKHIESIPITTLFITPSESEFHSLSFPELLYNTSLHKFEIGCRPQYIYIPIDKLYDDFIFDSVVHYCGSIFNISSTILMDISVSKEDLDKVPTLMLNFYKIVTQFNQIYLDKKLIIMIGFTNEEYNTDGPGVPPEASRLTVYCDPELMKQFEIFDAVVNFANVFKFGKIMIKPYIYEEFMNGWWKSIETSSKLNRSVTDFPLLVQRNVPLHLRTEMSLFNSFECINWTSNTIDTGIKFSKTFSGATVNTNGIKALNASLTKNEIRTLLLFSFGKFSLVEWLIAPNMRLETLSDAISKKFQNVLVASSEKDLYLELERGSVTSTLLSQIRSLGLQFANIDNFTFGVHLSGWENKDVLVFQQLKGANMNKHNKPIFYVGLTVDCVNEANNELKTLRNFTRLFPVNYIVCDMVSIVASNHNKDTMQKFLDTIFYLKTYIIRLLAFKPPQVYFRINYVPFGCKTMRSKVKDFLRFTNDVNQHAEIYKIKYFIFPAFGNNLFNKSCPVSWWKLSNDTDLANISVYIERESDYFDRPTLPGLTFTELPVVDDAVNGETNTLIIVLTFLFLATLFTIIALLVKLYHMRKRYLSKAEVQAFRNGKVAADGEIIELEEMKFLDKFEVEKHNVELCKVVGRGNFGVVYSGILNDEIPVAVKMPNSECSKQSFKCMLAEVKIMSYIGAHPNVLGLIATYTKEIRKGQIYIITELCEKGSLQNYLRSKDNSDSICSYELNRFAYQIAIGMDYISGKNIIHGDLSTRNVLLTEDGMCKIGDFGLSRKLYEYQKYIKKSKEPLPWRWMALESLQRMEFTTKSDVWSFGVTLWEIFSYGKIPYIGSVLSLSPEFVTDLENGLRLPKLENLSEDIFMKMNDCWDILPENRPLFSQLAQFFTVLQNN